MSSCPSTETIACHSPPRWPENSDEPDSTAVVRQRFAGVSVQAQSQSCLELIKLSVESLVEQQIKLRMLQLKPPPVIK